MYVATGWQVRCGGHNLFKNVACSLPSLRLNLDRADSDNHSGNQTRDLTKLHAKGNSLCHVIIKE